MNTRSNPALNQQSGGVLIVSLILLLVMTLLGVTAMQSNILEEKMAGNYRDQNLAFQAAEAALRDAEADIISSGRISGLTGFAADCTAGLCDATGGLSEVWKGATEPNGVDLGTHTGTASLPLVACQPRYWIEGFMTAFSAGSSASSKLGGPPRYRITAVACGGNQNTQVVLQEVYAP